MRTHSYLLDYVLKGRGGESREWIRRLYREKRSLVGVRVIIIWSAKAADLEDMFTVSLVSKLSDCVGVEVADRKDAI